MKTKCLPKVILPDLSYKINGILFEVHNNLGKYCGEKQYCDAIEKKLIENKIKYEREKIIPVSFEGEAEGRNKVDFLIEEVLLLEIKSKRLLEKQDYYQVKRYLEALKIELGILVNFRDKLIKPKRILHPY